MVCRENVKNMRSIGEGGRYGKEVGLVGVVAAGVGAAAVVSAAVVLSAVVLAAVAVAVVSMAAAMVSTGVCSRRPGSASCGLACGVGWRR
jgi:hypothetical protein